MTETPTPPQEQPFRDALVPSPIRSLMAIGFVLGMFACMVLDALQADFNGGPYILAFSAGAFLTLGYDVTRFLIRGWRGL